MQKGFVTFEVILAIIITALLMKTVVPNVSIIIDRVSLDYETKRLYSELRFVQVMSRSSRILTKGTGKTGVVTENGEKPSLIIAFDKNSYQVFRGTDSNKKSLREPHHISNNVKISFKNGIQTIMINFDEEGKASIVSDHLTLTSRLGKGLKIFFDTVGRFHVGK